MENYYWVNLVTNCFQKQEVCKKLLRKMPNLIIHMEKTLDLVCSEKYIFYLVINVRFGYLYRIK